MPRIIWTIVARKVTPGRRLEHRQPMVDLRATPTRVGKYRPHQGAQEKARRLRHRDAVA